MTGCLVALVVIVALCLAMLVVGLYVYTNTPVPML